MIGCFQMWPYLYFVCCAIVGTDAWIGIARDTPPIPFQDSSCGEMSVEQMQTTIDRLEDEKFHLRKAVIQEALNTTLDIEDYCNLFSSVLIVEKKINRLEACIKQVEGLSNVLAMDRIWLTIYKNLFYLRKNLREERFKLFLNKKSFREYSQPKQIKTIIKLQGVIEKEEWAMELREKVLKRKTCSILLMKLMEENEKTSKRKIAWLRE